MLDRQRLGRAVRHRGDVGGGEPGRRQAVATLTAPSTPTLAWARLGMKLRTVIAPS